MGGQKLVDKKIENMAEGSASDLRGGLFLLAIVFAPAGTRLDFECGRTVCRPRAQSPDLVRMAFAFGNTTVRYFCPFWMLAFFRATKEKPISLKGERRDFGVCTKTAFRFSGFVHRFACNRIFFDVPCVLASRQTDARKSQGLSFLF